MSDETSLPGARTYQLPYSVFAVLWAVAACFQAWYQLGWPIDPVEGAAAGVTVFLAVGVIGRPHVTGALALLAAWQVAWGLYRMPNMVEERFLALLVDTSLLVSYLLAVMVHSKRGVTVDDVYTGFAPVTRWVLLIALSFSVLAKCNSAFLDVDTSCAVAHWQALVQESAPALSASPWVRRLLVIAMLVVESGIVVGLGLPPLRQLTVGVATVFYTSIAFSGICYAPDYAFTLFPLLFLFAGQHVTDRVANSGQTPTAFRSVSLPGVMAVVASIVALAAFAMALRTENVQQMARFYHWLRAGTALICGLLWCGRFLWALRTCGPQRGLVRSDFAVANPLQWVVLVAALVSGVCPYVGWKTRLAFTQYCNLCTENHASNHLFLPQTYLGDFQLQWVRVLESSDPQLSQVAQRGLMISRFQLIRLCSQAPEASIQYQLADGETMQVARIADVQELSTPPPWWQSKLMVLRPLATDGCSCQR